MFSLCTKGVGDPGEYHDTYQQPGRPKPQSHTHHSSDHTHHHHNGPQQSRYTYEEVQERPDNEENEVHSEGDAPEPESWHVRKKDAEIVKNQLLAQPLPAVPVGNVI